MKIEIELNGELIQNKVTDSIRDRIFSEISSHVKNMLGLVFMEEIRNAARKEIELILKDLTFPDGRTFHQYIEDLILRPNKSGYSREPRLIQLIDDRVQQESERIFREIVKDHIEIFKNKLTKAVISQITGD